MLLRIICLVFIFIISQNLFPKGIDGLEPVYDYSEFLITDIPYGVIEEGESRANGGVNRFEFGGGVLFLNNYFLEAKYEDEEANLTTKIAFRQQVNEAEFGIGYRDAHYLTFIYTDWEHQQEQRKSKFSSANTFNLYSGISKHLSLKSSFYFLSPYKKNEVETIDITGVSLREELSYQSDNRLFITEVFLPYQKEIEFYQASVAFAGTGENWVFGGGVSHSYIQNSQWNPLVFFHYNHRNRLNFKGEVKEELEEYPWHLYRTSNSILFKSKLPAGENSLFPVRNFVSRLEGNLHHRNTYHRLSLEHNRASSQHFYSWTETDAEALYTIEKRKKQRDSVQLNYELRRESYLLFAHYNLKSRIDFQPLLSVGFQKDIYYRVFNEFSLRMQLHHKEAETAFLREMISGDLYLSGELNYRFTKHPVYTIEGGIAYSRVEYDKSFFDNNSTVYFRIGYGKRKN